MTEGPAPAPYVEPTAPAQPASSRPPVTTVLVSLVLVSFFLWLTYQMFFVRTGEEELVWARSMAIYSVVEAFALAAAGVLLGTQIQSGRVKAAEQRAGRKEAEADQAKKEAAKSNSELGGYRRGVRQALNHLGGASRSFSAEAGGATAAAARSDVEVARGILESLD